MSAEHLELAQRVEDKLDRVKDRRGTCAKWLKQLDILRKVLTEQIRKMTSELADSEEQSLRIHARFGLDFRHLTQRYSFEEAIKHLQVGKPGEGFQLLREASLYELAAAIYPFETRVTLLVKTIIRNQESAKTRDLVDAVTREVDAINDDKSSRLRLLEHFESVLDKEIETIEDELVQPLDILLLGLQEDVITKLGEWTYMVHSIAYMAGEDWLDSAEDISTQTLTTQLQEVEDRAWYALDDTSDDFLDSRPGGDEFDERMGDFRASEVLERCRIIKSAINKASRCPESGSGCLRGGKHREISH